MNSSAGKEENLPNDSRAPALKEDQSEALSPAEQLNLYFQNSLDLICIAETNGKLLRVNPQWEKVLGYTESELTGRSFMDFLHPEDVERTREAVSTLENQELVLNFENRYLAKDGSCHWLEWRSYPQGQTIYATARDVTERKKMEQDLEEVRAELDRLNLLLEQTNEAARVGGWEFDLETETLWWSDMTRALHEVGPDFQPTLDDGIHFYREGESRQAIKEAVSACVTFATPYDLDLQIVTALGNVRWVRAVGRPVLEKGRCVRMYGALLDIHDSKTAQLELEFEKDKFKKLFEASPLGIVEVEFETGRFLNANERFLEDCGYTLDELLTLSTWDLTPDVSRSVDEEMYRTLGEEKTCGPFQKFFRHKSGHLYSASVIGFLFQNGGKKPIAWSIVTKNCEICQNPGNQ